MLHHTLVASFTGAWIETVFRLTSGLPFVVASFTGAWIETGRGRQTSLRFIVASFTGAWIETALINQVYEKERVASFTGAWIETKKHKAGFPTKASHPLRVRGLKLYNVISKFYICRRILYGCVD